MPVLEPSDSRRRSLRIHYPAHLAPELQIGYDRYRVIDLSEGGCSLAVFASAVAHAGAHLRGVLRFREGSSLPVEGDILRSTTGELVIEFIHPIPVGYIQREAAMFGGDRQDRRRFFRFRYPHRPYPQLVGRNLQHDVIEISEAAVVLYCPEVDTFFKGQQIMGSLIFEDHSSLPIAGAILRMTATEVVVSLARFIPAERVIKEQQYVQQRGKRG